jgi:hypothetical protein
MRTIPTISFTGRFEGGAMGGTGAHVGGGIALPHWGQYCVPMGTFVKHAGQVTCWAGGWTP